MSQNHSQTPDYPLRWEADVVLRDGSLAHVRPITPNDTERIHRFHAGQSERSIYMRFFAPIKKLSDETVHTFTHVDHDQRAALVALTGDNIIGIARYDRLHDPRTAEVAFNIADSCQGKGVGSVLLEHLAVIAHEKGIDRFIAEVLPTNRQMLAVFTDAGYEITRAFEEGIITVEFTIETTEKTANVQLAREHHAEASSMARTLRPHGIAIIGASRRPHAIGTTILDNLLDGGYTGPIHVISTEATTLRGLPVYRTARDIPQPADLAIIAVPPPTILTVLDDCAAAGIKAACIIGTGYAESGPEGEHLQNQLLRHARRLGLRIVGPASAGIANHDPTISLNATVTTIPTTPGHIGIFAQSGGVASALLSTLSHRKLGLSTFCSAGNRIDVSGNDFMQFLIDDDTTDVAGLYLESVGNARKFSRIARQLSLRKPIVCVKTDTQHTIPTGHRARATTLPPQAFNTMLNQAGVIHAASVHELANTCELLAGQPLPASNHVALISNSPGILAILHNDANTAGLTPTHTTPLPLNSPVEDIAAAIHTAATTPNVDAILIALAPPLHDSEETVAAAISHTQWAHHTPIAATFIGMRDVRDTMHRCSHHTPNNRRRTIPTYPTPAEAATAMGHAATYATWLATEHSSRVNPDNIDRTAASTLINNLLTSHPNGLTLTDTQTHQLLNTIGIHPWPLLEAATP
ncbi:GNAT family N-acetyltransferase, partial [Dermatophilus congolensis]